LKNTFSRFNCHNINLILTYLDYICFLTKDYLEWDASWIEEGEALKNIKLVEQTRSRLQPYVTGSYVNVPDLNIKNYGKEYYGENFARLQKVKAKYDPENIFNLVQSIPPASTHDH
jgi:hypothetical protein